MGELPQGNASQQSGRRERRPYRGSIFWPVILVTLGIVFLLRNLGVLSGDAWDNLARLWPVLLIAIGLDNLYRREGVAGAVFWIGLGVVFLLTNLGVYSWNAWEVVLNLWPILLIAIGLDIVFGRRSTWGAVIAMVVLIAILVGSLWFLGGGVSAGQTISGEEISQALQGATEVSVVLKPSVGSLYVDALTTGSQNLVQGTIRERRGETVRQDYAVSQGKANFSLRSEGVSGFFMLGRGPAWDWRLSFSPSIPLEIEAGLGVGSLTLDLSALQIRALALEMGVGQATVILPAKGPVQAKISGAIGEMVVVIPAGAQARINADTGLAGIEVPASFIREGDLYRTSGFDAAEDRIDLQVSQAIGKITVRFSR